ncbi:MAG: MBOAT family protein [Rhodospirillaceae bacterium]|nr:MBOAT family protein [Rhodospirillaceae bacterium]MCA8932655.1 MBOAT family protein [Rhodospirillaceae bacterium]
MLFPTLDFGIFFLIVFFVSWALRGINLWRKWFLVGASYFFYGYWDWRFCFLLAISSAVNYVAGVLIQDLPDGAKRQWVLRGAIIFNIGVLGFFKYFEFFLTSFNDMMLGLGLEREIPLFEIILPVGISFFTFQGVSYVMDVARRDIPASRSLLDVLLYISFFPQLVAGPIVRASTLIPQIEAKPDPQRILMSMGLLLVLLGLFKKMVIANYLATEIVDQVFEDPSYYHAFDLLLAIWGYAIQIYCDFSAYSDIAIGVAAMLGYRFQKNFNQPFRSESIRELWRRWHISLSTWLRDYLYIPLGGNRGGPWKARRNLFLTMFLGGMWHGAAWHFLFWGGLHGVALVIETVLTHGRQLAKKPLWLGPLLVFYAFNFNCLSFIFFRSEDLSYAFLYLQSFGNFDLPVMFWTPFLMTLVFGGLALHFLPEDGLERVERYFRRLPLVVQGGLAGLGIVAIDAMGPDGVAPFIYFQF